VTTESASRRILTVAIVRHRNTLTYLLTYFVDIGSQPGVNYPNLVMGPFDWGNGLFSTIGVLTTTYFIEHKPAWEKQTQP